MNIAIIGATGKTGRVLVQQALDKGHQITVIVRDPNRLPQPTTKLNIIAGNFDNKGALQACLKDQDAVYCLLGSKDLYKNTGVRTAGTRAIIEAMETTGVQRLVVMSAMGVGESWKNLSLFNKFLFAAFMPAARQDHEDQEALVKSSSLEWTIIRPSGLVNTPEVSSYEAGPDIRSKTSQISRSNVADFMLKVVESHSHIREALTITN